MKINMQHIQYLQRQIDERNFIIRQQETREIHTRQAEEILLYDRNARILQTYRNRVIDLMA